MVMVRLGLGHGTSGPGEDLRTCPSVPLPPPPVCVCWEHRAWELVTEGHPILKFYPILALLVPAVLPVFSVSPSSHRGNYKNQVPQDPSHPALDRDPANEKQDGETHLVDTARCLGSSPSAGNILSPVWGSSLSSGSDSQGPQGCTAEEGEKLGKGDFQL